MVHDNGTHNKRHLILHFDINQTIIIFDNASKKSLSTILNSCISKQIYGEECHDLTEIRNQFPNYTDLFENLNEKENSPNSKSKEEKDESKRAFFFKISENHLDPNNSDEKKPSSKTIPYSSYVDKELYPFPLVSKDPIVVGEAKKMTKQQILDINQKVKDKRRVIFNDFTEKKFPGHIFKDLKQKMMDKIKIPDHILQDYQFDDENRIHLNEEQKRQQELFKTVTIKENGTFFYHILPGFFKLILWLVSEMEKDPENFSFSIVFRSFASVADFKRVIEEFNLFCFGNHPFYKEEYSSLSDFSKNYLRDVVSLTQNNQFGITYVNGFESDKFHFFRGSVERPPFLTKVDETINEEKIIEWAKTTEISEICCGLDTFYDSIVQFSKTGKSQVIGIPNQKIFQEKVYKFHNFSIFFPNLGDFWHFWNLNSEMSSAGKVFVFDSNDKSVIQMFLDDNCVTNDFPAMGIVRLCEKSQPGCPSASKHLYESELNYGGCLCDVNTGKAILEDDYFIEQIQQRLTRVSNSM